MEQLSRVGFNFHVMEFMGEMEQNPELLIELTNLTQNWPWQGHNDAHLTENCAETCHYFLTQDLANLP